MKKAIAVSAVVAACLALPLAGRAAPSFAGQVAAAECRARSGIGNFAEKARAGAPVKVAYFGGSITEMDGWRRLSLEWLRARHPDCAVTEIAAAIGGTGSPLGVYRFGQDVLDKDPDLVFVEFATNDNALSPEEIWRNFDGFIRQAWRRNPAIDFVFVYTITQAMAGDYGRGLCPRAASAMEQLADHYGIPSICFGPRVMADVAAGRLVITIGEFATAVPEETPDRDAAIAAEMAAQGKTLFSKDGVHPVLDGHAYYLESIKAAWPQLEQSAPVDHAPSLAAPFYDATLEAAKMVSITEDMLSGSWRRLGPGEQNGNFGARFGEQPWFSETPGDRLRLYVRGTGCTVYDLVGPDCGQVWVTVDGLRKAAPVARFDKFCTYYRVGTLVAFSGAEGVHEIEFELDSDQPSRLPVKEQGVTDEELAGPKYDGTKWIAGRLMVVGDVISESEAKAPLAYDPDPAAWFDAAVPSCVLWPRDAALAFRGEWTTDAASLADVAEVPEPGILEFATGLRSLFFGGERPLSLERNSLECNATVTFHAFDIDDLPPVDPVWKASIVAVREGGALSWRGLSNGSGGTNEWTLLEGAAPRAESTTAAVRITLRRSGGATRATYEVDGTVLRAGGRAAVSVADATATMTGVSLRGGGELRFLASRASGNGTLLMLSRNEPAIWPGSSLLP